MNPVGLAIANTLLTQLLQFLSSSFSGLVRPGRNRPHISVIVHVRDDEDHRNATHRTLKESQRWEEYARIINSH